jgi:hypothetical protein
MSAQSYEFYIFASYIITAIFIFAAGLHSWRKAKIIAAKSRQD